MRAFVMTFPCPFYPPQGKLKFFTFQEPIPSAYWPSHGKDDLGRMGVPGPVGGASCGQTASPWPFRP